MSWLQISQYLGCKKPKQCSYRFNKINAEISRNTWSETQELKLIYAVDFYDENFDYVKHVFPQSTVKELKCKYYKDLFPKLFKFNSEEDDILMTIFSTREITADFEKILQTKGWLSIKRRMIILIKLKGGFNENSEEVFRELVTKLKNYYESTSKDNLFCSKLDDRLEYEYVDSSATTNYYPSIDKLSSNSSAIHLDLLENMPSENNFPFSLFDGLPSMKGQGSMKDKLIFGHECSGSILDHFILSHNRSSVYSVETKNVGSKHKKVEFLSCFDCLQKKIDDCKQRMSVVKS